MRKLRRYIMKVTLLSIATVMLVLLVILKTGLDIKMHIRSHRKAAEQSGPENSESSKVPPFQ